MRNFIINKKGRIKSVGLMVALIVIFIAVAFIPLRGRLYAQPVLENANPSKTSLKLIPPTAGEKRIIIVVSNRGEIFIEKKRGTRFQSLRVRSLTLWQAIREI